MMETNSTVTLKLSNNQSNATASPLPVLKTAADELALNVLRVLENREGDR